MRRLLAAIILSLSMSAITTGHTSEPIKPVPDEAFKPLILTLLPTPSPTPSPTPEPTAKPTPKPTARPTAESTVKPQTGHNDKTYAIVRGTASTYGSGYAGFLALPEGPGYKVKVTGPGGSIIRVSNDAGPSLEMQRAGRIIDLNSADFNIVCGCNWETKGLVDVKVEYLR